MPPSVKANMSVLVGTSPDPRSGTGVDPSPTSGRDSAGSEPGTDVRPLAGMNSAETEAEAEATSEAEMEMEAESEVEVDSAATSGVDA
jgi:hypothetical protein